MDDRTRIADVEAVLHDYGTRHESHHMSRHRDDPLAELARLVDEADEKMRTTPAQLQSSHPLLSRLLGASRIPPVRPPRLDEAFYARPFFTPEFERLHDHNFRMSWLFD